MKITEVNMHIIIHMIDKYNSEWVDSKAINGLIEKYESTLNYKGVKENGDETIDEANRKLLKLALEDAKNLTNLNTDEIKGIDRKLLKLAKEEANNDANYYNDDINESELGQSM